MHLKQIWLGWIENRLSPGERHRAQAHLAGCPECRAELGEVQDLVETLEAIPSALSALPWKKERLWPAIRVGLRAAPAVPEPGQWVRWVSAASLLVVFCGVWLGSGLEVAPAATVEASFVARPPSTPQGLVTPPQDMPAGHGFSQAALSRGTPQPLPAPVQTPIVVATALAGTVAPGD